MKTTATLFTCFIVSLLLASENASAGNNRFSGKSGKSSSSRSFGHHGNRNNNHRSKNFNNRSSNSQYNHRSTNQRFSQNKKPSMGQHNYKASYNSKSTPVQSSKFSKRNNYHFKPAPKQNVSNKLSRFDDKRKINPQHKAIQRPFKTDQKTIKHNKFHGHHNGHHNVQHGHHHWNRSWIHINTRSWCPPVCRPWFPVPCAEPVLTPCVITACAPLNYNEAGETVVEVSEGFGTEEIAETQTSPEPVEQELLELVSGKLFQLSAEGLGNEQGMVVLEINEMGLPAKIEKWEDNILAFQTPQIGLAKATEAKMHVMNSKGQLLATLDINLLPATESVTNPVASN